MGRAICKLLCNCKIHCPFYVPLMVMKHCGLMSPCLLIAFLLLTFGCVSNKFTNNTLNEGFTGLVLIRNEANVSVGYIYPGSPAAEDGRLKMGDRILAVSRYPNTNMWISADQATADQFAALFKGTLNSSIVIKALEIDAPESSREKIVILKLTNRTSYRQPNGSIAYGFVPRLALVDKLSEDDRRLHRVTRDRWVRVAVGMATNEVVRTLGRPLTISPRHESGQEIWEYGYLLNLNGKLYRGGSAMLHVSNGHVSKAFRLGDTHRSNVEFLSLPE